MKNLLLVIALFFVIFSTIRVASSGQKIGYHYIIDTGTQSGDMQVLFYNMNNLPSNISGAAAFFTGDMVGDAIRFGSGYNVSKQRFFMN